MVVDGLGAMGFSIQYPQIKVNGCFAGNSINTHKGAKRSRDSIRLLEHTMCLPDFNMEEAYGKTKLMAWSMTLTQTCKQEKSSFKSLS